jgi:molybdopterin-guanine dinucleotide biosynthesis protein A
MSGGSARPGAGAGGPDFDAIILAGGRGARLGGADKPGLVVGAESMAAAVARAAVAAGARRVVLVGPARPDLAQIVPPEGLLLAREDPPGAGPVPALRAGLREARAPWVAVLAADLPFLRASHLRAILDAATADLGPGRPRSTRIMAEPERGALLADDTDRAQWLTGCWPAAGLRAALAGYDGPSLRGLLGPLDPVLVRWRPAAGEPPPWLDCDTPEALAAARGWPGTVSRPSRAGSPYEHG